MIKCVKGKDNVFDFRWKGNAQDVAEELAVLMGNIKTQQPAVWLTASVLFEKGYNKEGKKNG